MDARLAMVLSLCAACGASAEDPAATGGGSGDGSSAAGSGSTSGGGEQLTHGKVVFEFRRSENEAANPSVGTSSVSITTTYRDCLGDFYDANPNLRQTGPDGELVFGGLELGGEGWHDRLCDPDLVPLQADCSIVAIEQRLDPVKQLTVTYGITGQLENRQLAFGPLPTSETAGCLDPIVRAAVGGVKGYAEDGAVIWEASAIEPLDAVTDQGGAISVRMEANGD